MHDTSIFWLRVAVVLYAAGLAHSILTVLRRRMLFFRFAMAAFSVGATLHLVSIAEQWLSVGRLPAGNFFESVSLCAFLIAVLFLFVHWRYQFDSLGVFVFPLVFLMALVGSTEVPITSWPNATAGSVWLMIHIFLVMLGYAALLLTALASVFYLIQERQLKKKSSGGFFEKLPPLGTLDDIIDRSMAMGFALLTLATIVGSAWAFIQSGTRWIGDPKIAISLFTWLLCLVLVFMRSSAGWRGRKAALLSLTVLGCSALTWAAHVGLRPVLSR